MTTNVSNEFMQFPYALQPWVIKYIKQNKSVCDELKKLIKNEGFYLSY